jgi:uncharacterized repeat protein (TIGR02543 family)
MQWNKLYARALAILLATVLMTAGVGVLALPASAAGLTQTSPTSVSTTVDASTGFTDLIVVSGTLLPVTFTVSVSVPGLNVSPSGSVSTTGGPLAVGSYTDSGTDSDGVNSGTWTYTLVVNPSTITQATPTSGTSTDANSAAFTDALAVTGNNGAVSFSTSSATSGLVVSTTGAVSTTGGPLAAGPYSATGSDTDVDGDTGSWIYTLTVTATAPSPPPKAPTTTIVQSSATSGSTTTPNSSAFVPPALTVENNVGVVTFTTTTTSPGLNVTSSGVISVTHSLAAGTYTVSGSDKDGSGDTGTWNYSLTVTDTFSTVTFVANGGKGTMALQREDQPSPLTINSFTRTRYTFIDWNTSPSGSGADYVNGASYSFSTPITLYAQWRAGKIPFHKVTFMANGGKGNMAVERHNGETALSPVHFSRSGYTFIDWNTKANGSGTSYLGGAAYSFRSSRSLFAQWKKNPRKPVAATFTVTFVSNGGRGVMAGQSGKVSADLEPAAFSRPGYIFAFWNTKANGSGTGYANRAHYSFKANLTLYAQWHKNKVVIPPAVDASATVGPFEHKSSALNSTVESQINELAATVKSHHDTKIMLMGYGDSLSKADQLNESLWAANFTLSQNRAT